MEDKTSIKKVEQFNKSFGLTINKNPKVLSESESELKFTLMQEELFEYKDACKNNNLIEIVDAIVDMQYILDGIKLAHGIQDSFDVLFDEVHQSNMSKLENGKVLKRNDGKILKGKNYFEPDLKKILKKWI